MMHRLVSLLLFFCICLTSIASTSAITKTPSDTPAATTGDASSLKTTTTNNDNAFVNDWKLYLSSSSSDSRKLQAQDFGRIFASLADTPIDQWTGAQWLCLLILLVIVSLVFNCLCGSCCRRRYNGTPYYGQGGYYGGGSPSGYYGNSGGRCCSFSDLFWCLCCFEWCCRDCQDVDNCCNAVTGAGGSVYQGGEMV